MGPVLPHLRPAITDALVPELGQPPRGHNAGMSTAKTERGRVVRAALELDLPVGEAQRQLARFPFDCDEELVLLERRHLLQAVTRLEQGLLSEHDLAAWAEFVHGRDEVGLDEHDRDFLLDALLRLSTPEINAPVAHTAAELRRQL